VSDVTDLLAALRDGTLTTDEVAERFRTRQWPGRTKKDPTTFLELATADQEDPEPDVPGSFDEVTAAYARGEINRQQYRTLAHAAGDSTGKGA
jgi:DNA-binding ferritin-like protein